MIHNTYLIRISTREVLASTQYWPVTIETAIVDEFVTTREELHAQQAGDSGLGEIALIVGDYKFHGKNLINDILLLFATDKGEEESSVFEKVDIAVKLLKKELNKSGLDSIIQSYSKLIEPSITTRLKIALVGEGGVGKTTTLHLLLGDTPPLQYVPTIALNLETVENIRFGNYSLVLWDFAGQERFRTLWRFYFHGADVIFLVCDSTLRNVIISKDILKLIKRDAPKVPVFAMANKQDKPNAMKPEVVQKILGIPTYPMVAIDKARRDEMLRILMTAAAQYVGVALPDLPASELLKFTDKATEEAIAEVDSIEERAELQEEEVELEEESEYETIEIVEEVLVDEEGHVIENLDEYEIVEETIEEVDDIFPIEEIDVEEDEVEITPSPIEEAIEETPVPEWTPESEVSDIHLIHREFEHIEEEALGEMEDVSVHEEVPVVEETSIDESESEEFELITLGDEITEAEAMQEVSIEIELGEKEEALQTIDIADKLVSTESYIESEPIGEDNDVGVQMARDIIFEALEADDFLSAELGQASHAEIDEALEALGSDEALPANGESEHTEEIDEESLQELEMILGPLDKAVGGTKTHEPDEEEDSSHLPINDESLDELSRLLDYVDSDDYDED